MKKSCIVLAIIICIIGVFTSFAEVVPDLGFSWIRGNTLDNFLKETTGAADDEVMLTFDISEVNTYKLTYNTEDGEETQVIINKRNQDLDFTYKVLGWDGAGFNTDITKDNYIDGDFEEWDFNNQVYTIPETLPDPNVTYTINRTDPKTGKIFIVKNQTIKFFWDTSKGKAYFATNGLKKGNINTFKIFVNAEGTERKKLDVLRTIDLEAVPTHWITDGGLVNEVNIEMTSDETKQTGMHPGIKVNIGRPKAWDVATRTFVPISDAEQPKIGMTLNIKQKPVIGEETNPPSVQYTMTLADIADVGKPGEYDAVSKQYILNIVKDDPATLDSSFLRWTDLNYSTVYETVNVILENLGNATYEYNTEYRLTGDVTYGYTYLNYTVERKNIDDTYIVINPYRTQGIYEVYYANSEVTDPNSLSFKKWVSHATDASSDPIYIPINVSRTEIGTQYYTFRIDYKVTEESPSISSQLLLYDANSDDNFNPPVPSLGQIEDLIVVPALVEGVTEPEKVSFKIVWKNTDKIVNMLGDNNKIYFELYINTMLNDYTDATNSEQNQFYQLVKVIYMRKQGDDIQISLDDTNYTNVDLTKPNFETQITLKDDSGWIGFIEPTWDADGYTVSYADGDPLLYKNDFFDSAKGKVPGNYFITMRAIFDADTTDDINKLNLSDYSVPISFFLDIKDEMLNIPTNIEQKEVTDSSFKLAWDDTDITEYKKYMLDPIDITVDEKKYEVLISESIGSLKTVMNDDDVKGNKDIEIAGIIGLNYAGEFTKPASDQITDVAMTADNIDDLRDDNVLAFRIEENQVKISNLEPNVVYYVVLRTRLNMYQGLVTNKLYRFSGVSAVEPVTIQKDIQLPDDSEKTPPAPENLEVVETALDYIELQWTQPIITSASDETIGFDIVRLEGYPVKDEHRASLTKLEDIISNVDYSEVKAWKIRQDDLYIYDTSTDAFVADIDNTIQNVSNSNDKLFYDNKVTENKIYYYYVRTVRVGASADKSNSSWNEIAVTTDPMKAPINLAIETKDYTYDNYYEAVIEFDAPITDESKIPNEYEFGIALKSQDDSAYIETKDLGGDTQLDVLDNAEYGYKKYVYKLTNLKSGKKYSVKVRIYDKTGGILDDGRYLTSAYCGRVEFRTQFNQNDYDIESKYTDYTNYYLDKVRDILKKSYWSLNNGTNLEIKYKENMLNAKLDLRSNNIYDLDDKTTASEFIYYFPASCVEKINKEKINLRKIRGNLQVILPPNVVDEAYTTELANIIKGINMVNDTDLTDYYLKLTLKYNNKTTTVNTDKALTDEVSLKFDVMTLGILDNIIEEEFVTKYNDLVTEYKGALLEDIEDEMGDVLDDEKYYTLLEDTMKNLNDDIADEIGNIISDNDTGTTNIAGLYKAFMLQVTDATNGVKGYKKVSSKWEEVPVIKYLSQAYISSTVPTSYIFGSADDIDYTQILSSNTGVILNVYNKFNLSSIMDVKDLKTPSNPIASDVVKKMILQVLRVTAKDDFERSRKEQELINSFDLPDSTPTKQQTIYNVIKLYEKIKGINTNNMYIKDYSVLNYLQNVDDKYKQSIIVANELKIIDAKTFKPDEGTIYEDLFMYLGGM